MTLYLKYLSELKLNLVNYFGTKFLVDLFFSLLWLWSSSELKNSDFWKAYFTALISSILKKMIEMTNKKEPKVISFLLALYIFR